MSTRTEIIVMEFHGNGDPYFGGSADDRVLGKSGSFLTGCYSRDDYALFSSKEEGLAAAERAPNRRTKGLLLATERA